MPRLSPCPGHFHSAVVMAGAEAVAHLAYMEAFRATNEPQHTLGQSLTSRSARLSHRYGCGRRVDINSSVQRWLLPADHLGAMGYGSLQ